MDTVGGLENVQGSDATKFVRHARVRKDSIGKLDRVSNPCCECYTACTRVGRSESNDAKSEGSYRRGSKTGGAVNVGSKHRRAGRKGRRA
jgi:hypothetical protein